VSLVIEPASEADATEILALQKLAYQSEARIYDDDTIPPLHQTLDEMRQDIARETVLKATEDARIIGSVRARLDHEATCHIGRLIVAPDCQGRGLGQRLMRAIEDRFAEAARYELFTGHRSERNLHLYRKLGYQAFREEPVGSRVTVVFLEKRSHAGRPSCS
jgi:ribosomal protein S18 acetylase RimI-like enzyme